MRIFYVISVCFAVGVNAWANERFGITRDGRFFRSFNNSQTGIIRTLPGGNYSGIATDYDSYYYLGQGDNLVRVRPDGSDFRVIGSAGHGIKSLDMYAGVLFAALDFDGDGKAERMGKLDISTGTTLESKSPGSGFVDMVGFDENGFVINRDPVRQHALYNYASNMLTNLTGYPSIPGSFGCSYRHLIERYVPVPCGVINPLNGAESYIAAAGLGGNGAFYAVMGLGISGEVTGLVAGPVPEPSGLFAVMACGLVKLMRRAKKSKWRISLTQ